MYKKKAIFLIIYSLAAFLIFTYILFPVKAFQKKIETTFSQYLPAKLIIQDISILFPLQLVIKKPLITFPAETPNKEPLKIDLSEVKTSFNLLKLFKGKGGIDIGFAIGSGEVNAEIDRQLIGSDTKHFLVKVRKLSIEELTFIKQKFGINMSGIAKAGTEVKWSGNDISKSIGSWSFTIEKGRIIPKHFPQFNYDSASGTGAIRDGTIHIDEIRIQGQDLFLRALGEIKAENGIGKPYIDTQVKLKISPNFAKKLGFFSNLMPKPDSEGFINIFIFGPPDSLQFSSNKKG